jgi:hypothetical protein
VSTVGELSDRIDADEAIPGIGEARLEKCREALDALKR